MKKMKKLIFMMIIFTSLIFGGCNKFNGNENLVRNFDMNTDLASLSERFTIVNEPITWANDNFKSSSSVGFNEVWRLESYIDANNDTLSASSVEIIDGIIFVGSHLNNYKSASINGTGGEIAIISSVNGITPTLIGSAYDAVTDYNDMEIGKNDPTNLWIVGDNNSRGAVILKVGLPAPGFVSAGPTLEMPIFGTSGNSITAKGNQLWVSSATHSTNPVNGGGLMVLQQDVPDQYSYSFTVAQAKQFDSDGAFGVLLYGESSTKSWIRVFDMDSPTFDFTDYPLNGYDVTSLGKNSVDVNGGFAYLAMGDDGIIKVNLATGVIVKSFKSTGKGMANGVKTDGQYVYVAYGQGGFYLLDKTSLIAIGHWNTEYSCNYVEIDPVEQPANSNHIYLANGRAGLICLERIDL